MQERPRNCERLSTFWPIRLDQRSWRVNNLNRQPDAREWQSVHKARNYIMRLSLPSISPEHAVHPQPHLSLQRIIDTHDPSPAKGQLERHACSQHALGRNNCRTLTWEKPLLSDRWLHYSRTDSIFISCRTPSRPPAATCVLTFPSLSLRANVNAAFRVFPKNPLFFYNGRRFYIFIFTTQTQKITMAIKNTFLLKWCHVGQFLKKH